MNDKPFTLYYIHDLKCINTYNFTTNAGKISDVRTVSKGFTILDFKENSNHYAICGDKLNVISMGMVKKIETKNKNIIYIGQKIYSSSQKELFDYYKRQFHKGIQYIESNINIQEQKVNTVLNNETNAIRDVQHALKDIQRYREIKVNAINIYRQTIEAIKKL